MDGSFRFNLYESNPIDMSCFHEYTCSEWVSLGTTLKTATLCSFEQSFLAHFYHSLSLILYEKTNAMRTPSMIPCPPLGNFFLFQVSLLSRHLVKGNKGILVLP